MTLRAAIVLVAVALAAAAPGSAAAPVENPVDGVLIGDVFLQHDQAPTASLSVVRADCDPDGVSTVSFHATGAAAQHGDANAGTFAVDATATIGPQRFANFAEDHLDAGKLLSFAATVTLQLGAATVVTTETLWEPGARPGQPLPEQPFLRHNYGFCNDVQGMDVSRARGATGRVVGIEAEARNLVAVGTGEAEGRAELLLWNGAYSSVTSGPLLDTRVAGIFGPAMAPYVFPAGTELRLARPRIVDGGTADPMTALAATVHDAGGALQDGAELRFTYAGDPVPSVCVTSGGGCWAVQTQPVTAAPARIHVAVLLDLNANGLADPGEPVRTAAYTTPSTQRVRATGLVRFAGLGTFPLRLLAGAFRGRVGGTLLLGPKDDPLARTQTFTSARFAAHSVALRAAGFTLTLVQPRTVTLQTRAGILRGRLVRGSIVFPR